ncbi:MAG: beta-lactamase family protein [Roseivirga sp.]|nr:beta-lactamase family protein [Roseivirga sp.]
MSKSISIIIIYLFTASACHAKQEEIVFDPPTSLEEAISQSTIRVEALLEEYPGLSVSVGLGDSIVWSEGFGFANTQDKEAMTSGHHLRYFSLSKSITGMALTKLIDSGKLDIEQSVTQYLPELPAHYQPVKVKHLISHTAGIRHYNKGEWMKLSQNSCQTAAEALDVFINDPLESIPGEVNQYSSFGYVLLSRLIEEISGLSYYGFLQAELFTANGIEHIHMDKSADVVNEVSYYSRWRPKKQSGKVAPDVNNTCKFGGGGLVGTASDLVKLHLKMLDGGFASTANTAAYYQSFSNTKGESVGYAFGLGSNTAKSGAPYNAHTGSGMGANCVMMIYPESKVVVVVLGNLEGNLMNSHIGKITKPFLELSNGIPE